MLEIKVLNKNLKKIVDYYDGIAYEFLPGEPVKIPQDAANHIFGVVFPEDTDTCTSQAFRESIFLHLAKRWGWNLYDEHKEKSARKTFAGLVMSPVIMELIEKEETPIAEPREAPKAKKDARFKPRANEIVGEEISPEVEEVA